jgi:hypothetical protein
MVGSEASGAGSCIEVLHNILLLLYIELGLV